VTPHTVSLGMEVPLWGPGAKPP